MENNTLPESFALNELQRIEKDEMESRATAALASSEGKSPDLVAETQRLSSKFGYSPDVIERNLEEFKRREKVEGIDINGLLEGNADALAWVADPKNAPLVSDDPSILARVARNIKDFPASVGDSVDTQSLIELRYKQMWGGLTPEEMVQADELSRKMDSTVRGTGGFWSEGFQAVGSNSVQMARTMGAGLAGGLSGRGIGMVIGGAAGALVGGVGAVPGAVAGGNIGGTVGSVGGAAYENFRQQSSLVYNDMLKLTDENGKGVDPDVARGSAIVVGGINAGLDLIAFNKLAKTIPGFERVQAFLSRGGIEKAIKMPGLRQALATIGKKYATGVTYEALTEGAQELTQIIGEGFVKDNSDGHFSETPVSDGVARVARATAGGAGMAIFMGGAGSSVSAIKEYKNRNTMPPEKVMAHVDAINETVRDPNNKLFQRSPEAFHDYVSKIAPEDAFYVNGDAALQMVLSLPDDQRAALFNSMPNLRTELETAASAGSDVSISKADYATYIAPTSIAEMLKPYMKVDPEGKSLHDIQAEQAFAKDNPQAAQAMQNLLRSIPEGEQAEEVGGMVQRLIRKSLADAGANEGEVKTASALFAAQARQYYRLFGDKWKDHFLGSLLEFQTEDETGQPVKKGSNFSVLLNDLEKLKAGKTIAGMDDETRAAVEQFGKRIEEAGLTPQEVRGMESNKLVDTLFAPRPAPVVEIGDVAVTMPDVQVEQTPEGNVTIQQAPSEEDLQRTKDTLNRYVQAQREVAERTRQEAQAQRDQDQRVKEAETIKEHLPETKSEEQGVKPEPVVEKKPDATKIEDFGQKLEGARKDVWQKYNAAMQEKIPADLKDVTLTKYFPEPDYEDMIARGVGQAELAVVKAMRDMVPAKPRNPTELRIWANKLNEYRDFANDILNGTFTAQGLLDHLTSKGGYLTLSLRDKLQLYIDVGYPAFRSVKGWEIDRRAFTEYMGQKFNPAQTMWFFKSPQREYSAPFVERSDMVAALRDAILKKPDDKGVAEVKFDIYQNTKTGEIFIGKKIGAGKFIDLKGGFTKASEARAYLKENKEALSNLLEKMKEIRPERREKNAPRVGKDYRNGVPVTPEKFMAEFGFRGVQFGNYVEQAKRSEDMDRSYDALLDMAAIIGIPTRALSLNGSLGIAFGARGKGGKGAPAAHYEPEQAVINLTKGQGAGSLAHEWFHALDNFFGTQGNDKYATTGEANATVRPEVREAFLNITKVLQKSGMYSRSLLRDQRRSGKPYWTKRIEMGARAFEAYIAFKLKEQSLSNDFLVNIVDEDVERVFNEMQGRKNDFPYPTKEEMTEVAQAFETFLGMLKTEETEAGVKLYQGEKLYPIAPKSEWYGEANYEENGGRIVYMTPDRFLSFARPLDIDEASRDNIDTLKDHIENGGTLDPLALFENGKEDGRHRAYAAKELGIKKVPVVVFGERIERGVKLYQAAYHGSPYRFERFDLSKIGSGEGAQAFGWGQYFAESQDVAEDYRKTLAAQSTEAPVRLFKGERLEKGSPEYHAATLLSTVGSTLAGVKKEVRGWIKNAKEGEDVGHYKKVLKTLEEATNKRDFEERPPEGQLYKVHIPDEDVARMLDWDKPLSEQSPEVKAAIKRRLPDATAFDGMDMGGGSIIRDNRDGKFASDIIHPWVLVSSSGNGASRFGLSQKDIDRMVGRQEDTDLTGQQIYSRFVAKLGNQKTASEALASAGITGIKYLDGTSRTAGEGTRNFVVFDQALLDKISDSIETLYQQEKGSFTRKKSEDFMERMRHVVISMTKDKNMSTLAHEFSHYAVASHRAFAQLAKEMQLQGDGRKELQTFIEDWEALKNAVGAKDDKFTTEQEEQVARWFEGYLREGKAPSDRLRPVFSRFKSWLVSIYRDVQAYMGAEMPKEVEEAFNRWLASEDEIQTALGRNASIMEIVKQFNVEGLEDRITQHLADAIQIAEERQYKKHLAEDRKRETMAYKNEYATLRKQVYAEKIREPVYAALNWMKGNDVRFALEYVTKRTRGFNKKPPAWMSFEPILSRHWHVVEDIKDLRDPRRVKPPKVRSLLQFIASKGGIQDIGGDIKSMGGDSFKGLINKRGTEAAKTNRFGGMFGKQETSSNKKNGYSYNAMMEAVAEEGYFNRDMFGGDKALDYRDMLELIEKELGGSPVYRSDDMDEVHDYETRLKRMEEFDRILSENGLDAKRDSTIAILKRLEEIGLIDPGFEFEEREGEQPNEEPVYDAPDNLPQKDPELRKKITEDIVAEDGVSPDMIAERFGFDSGESLLKAIEKAQNFEFAVDAEARRRLHEKYPSMVEDGRIRVEAIESLYNDKTLVALDVLISEIGKTQGRTNNPGLRQFATALSLRQVELTKMGDANKTFRFEIARERELKAALKASREGNAEQAMLHLQRAMVAQLVFKRLENFKAVKERAMALFGKVDQKDNELAPSRDMDFIGAARFLLFKFGLGGENFQFQTWLEDLRGRDDNLIQDIAQAAGLMSDSVLPKNAKELTVSEFVEVYNAIKNLYRVARQAKEIEKEGRRIKIKTVVGELIEKMGGAVGEANPSTSFTKSQRIMQGVHSVRSALRRVEQWCGAMDGGMEGPFTTYIWRPISKAQAAFEAANDEWQSRYSSILKKYADSFKVPGKVETQLIKHDELGRPTKLIFNDRNALIGFMLHLGNESNMDKLLGGYGIDPDSVWYEIDRLEKTGVITGKDWELCQSLWDLMEEIKPQIQEAHRKLYGYRFTEIEPTPIIRGGKAFRGGYWPAVVQRGLSTNINALADVYENPAAYIIASTGRGFTKERTKGYREALVTDVRLGSSHLEQVNRFIHIEPAVREVSRIVNDGDFKAVLNTHDQSVHGDMIMPWLRRVARQEMEVIDKSSKFNRVVQTFSRFMRSSMSAQYIAYNIKVAAQDVANLSVVLHHVGPVRFAKAFTATLTSRDMIKDVRSMSAMMENRFNQKGEKAQVLIDQIVEGKGVFGKTRDFTRLHGNLFIQVIDGYLASAGWQAAFNKGVEEGMDDAVAVQYADRVVRDAFGSMTPSDVSAFEANHPVMRVLFPFMSYFIAQSNVAQTEMGNIMREYGWSGAPRLFMAYVSIIAAPAVIGKAIVDVMSGRMPDDDEGLEGWLAWLTESQLSYILGMIPGGNIIGSGIKYLYKKPNDLRASFNPLGSIGASAGRTIYTTKQIIEGQDVDEGKYLRDLLTTIGFVTGVPLGQVAKPISYAVDVANDKQSPDGPYDVLVGTVSGKQPKR